MPRRENLFPSLLRIQSRYGVTFVPTWAIPRKENLLSSLMVRIHVHSRYASPLYFTNLSNTTNKDLLTSLLVRIHSRYGVTFVPTSATPRTEIYFLLCWSDTVQLWRHLCTNLSNPMNRDLLPSLLVINTVLTIVPTWAMPRTEIYLLLSWSEYSYGVTTVPTWAIPRTEICFLLSWSETGADMVPALKLLISFPSRKSKLSQERKFAICANETSFLL